jgi:GAF domain
VIPSDRVARILTEVQADVETVAGVQVAGRLVSACQKALPITGASLSWLTDNGQRGLLAATDLTAELVEELQFSLGEGPCIESSRSGRPVLLPDLTRLASQQWPAFTASALSAGIAAIFAFPLQVGAISLGVMDLYRDVVGPLSVADIAQAAAFATAGTIVLLDLQASTESPDMHPLLAASLVGRAEVHQATGMIAVQMDVDLRTALVLLRARAYAANRDIIDLAHDVVQRRLRFEP